VKSPLLDRLGDLRAVLFDMDGTLIDSELLTEAAVASMLRDAGIDDPLLDLRTFYGITWRSATETLVTRHPSLAGVCTEQALHDAFHALWEADPPPPIPGALETLRAVGERAATAIVTSSNGASVETLLERFDLHPCLDTYVSSDQFDRSKPDPECYLLAASRLGVAPAECLVFEDSVAGIAAARSAGMSVIAITFRTPDRARAAALADLAIDDYRELPPTFGGRLNTASRRPPARRTPT